MTRKQKKLTAAILLGLCTGLNSLPVAAKTRNSVDYNGKPFFEVFYYDKGESTKPIDGGIQIVNVVTPEQTKVIGINAAQQFSLNTGLKDNLLKGLDYWAKLLAPEAKNPQPVQIFVGTENIGTANGGEFGFKKSDNKWGLTKTPLMVSYINNTEAFNSFAMEGTIDDGGADSAVCARIRIGRYLGAGSTDDPELGWYSNEKLNLPANEARADYQATIRHEMFHALGMISGISPIEIDGATSDSKGLPYYAFSRIGKNSWDDYLYDQNLNKARPDMHIMTSQAFDEFKKAHPDCSREDYFLVDNLLDKSYDGPEYAARGRAFFIGDNVRKTLDGATFFGVNGLPVNTWEDDNGVIMELAHINIGGMMTHEDYGNYTVPTEAELAVALDLGYKFDVRNYYGYSLYRSGEPDLINTGGYFARGKAADGTYYYKVGEYNTTPLGVGLHVYGSSNQVTQAADILTAGDGAVGVRVDGSQNVINIGNDEHKVKVHAQGENGIGVLISNGKEQTVNISKGSEVAAEGKNGTALQLDFGSSFCGAEVEYRGSYIRYRRNVYSEGKAPVSGYPYGSVLCSYNNEDRVKVDYVDGVEKEVGNGISAKEVGLDGALAENVNIYGTVKAAPGADAVRIGKNAFVRNINIYDGASVTGNITSEWKHFENGSYDAPAPQIIATEIKKGKDYKYEYNNHSLALQYKDSAGNPRNYSYDTYLPELVTDLNIRPGTGKAFTYDGNITGTDNLRLNVEAGRFNYSGSADILGVYVAEGGELFGGSCRLHDMTAKLGEICSESVARPSGKFINHGSIGALTPPAGSSSSLVINGDLVSDGTLVFTANRDKVGTIDVTGTVSADGSRLAIDKGGVYTPEKSYSTKFVSENGTPKTINWSQKEEYRTGLLTAAYSNDEVTFRRENNIPDATAARMEMVGAMNRLYDSQDAAGRDAMTALYNLKPAAAGTVLDDIRGGSTATAATMMQRSNIIGRVINDRLTRAIANENVAVDIPKANLTIAKAGNVNPSASHTLSTSPSKGRQSVRNDSLLPGGVKAGHPEPDSGSPTGGIALHSATKPALIVPVQNLHEYSAWTSFTKGWGELGTSGGKYHSSAISLGWDKQIAKNWRFGFFGTYNASSFRGGSTASNLKDWRLGIYGGYHRNADTGYAYLDYGWGRNELSRGLLGESCAARYNSSIIELGGEYKHDLTQNNKSGWHISPFVNGQLSRYGQRAYQESGFYGQSVGSLSNTYFAMGVGCELRRELKNGNYALRLGCKRAFCGLNPHFNFHFNNDGSGSAYSKRAEGDRNLLTLGLTGSCELAPRWTLSGDALMERGAHDRDYSLSVQLRYVW